MLYFDRACSKFNLMSNVYKARHTRTFSDTTLSGVVADKMSGGADTAYYSPICRKNCTNCFEPSHFIFKIRLRGPVLSCPIYATASYFEYFTYH